MPTLRQKTPNTKHPEPFCNDGTFHISLEIAGSLKPWNQNTSGKTLPVKLWKIGPL
jgi:hypothetical protein